eukprot:31549-Pelagococcus_subviridis.AAC.4
MHVLALALGALSRRHLRLVREPRIERRLHHEVLRDGNRVRVVRLARHGKREEHVVVFVYQVVAVEHVVPAVRVREERDRDVLVEPDEKHVLRSRLVRKNAATFRPRLSRLVFATVLPLDDPRVDEVQVHGVMPPAAAGDDVPHLEAAVLRGRFDPAHRVAVAGSPRLVVDDPLAAGSREDQRAHRDALDRPDGARDFELRVRRGHLSLARRAVTRVAERRETVRVGLRVVRGERRADVDGRGTTLGDLADARFAVRVGLHAANDVQRPERGLNRLASQQRVVLREQADVFVLVPGRGGVGNELRVGADLRVLARHRHAAAALPVAREHRRLPGVFDLRRRVFFVVQEVVRVAEVHVDLLLPLGDDAVGEIEHDLVSLPGVDVEKFHDDGVEKQLRVRAHDDHLRAAVAAAETQAIRARDARAEHSAAVLVPREDFHLRPRELVDRDHVRLVDVTLDLVVDAAGSRRDVRDALAVAVRGLTALVVEPRFGQDHRELEASTFLVPEVAGPVGEDVADAVDPPRENSFAVRAVLVLGGNVDREHREQTVRDVESGVVNPVICAGGAEEERRGRVSERGSGKNTVRGAGRKATTRAPSRTVVPVRPRAHVHGVDVVLPLARLGDVVRPPVEPGKRVRAVMMRGRDGALTLELVVRRRAPRAVRRQIVRLADDDDRGNELLRLGVLERVSPLQIRRDAKQRSGRDAVVPPERHLAGAQAPPAVDARRRVVEGGRAVLDPRAVLGGDARTANVRIWRADVGGEELDEGQHLPHLVPLERLRLRVPAGVLGFDDDVLHRRLRHRPGGHREPKPKRLQREVVLPVRAPEEDGVRGVVVDDGHARRRQPQRGSRARVAVREVHHPRRAPPLFEVKRGFAGDAPQGVGRGGRRSFGAGYAVGARDADATGARDAVARPRLEVELGVGVGIEPRSRRRAARLRGFGAAETRGSRVGLGTSRGDDRRLRERWVAAAGSERRVGRGEAGRASRREAAAGRGSEAGREGRAGERGKDKAGRCHFRTATLGTKKERERRDERTGLVAAFADARTGTGVATASRRRRRAPSAGPASARPTHAPSAQSARTGRSAIRRYDVGRRREASTAARTAATVVATAPRRARARGRMVAAAGAEAREVGASRERSEDSGARPRNVAEGARESYNDKVPRRTKYRKATTGGARPCVFRQLRERFSPTL